MRYFKIGIIWILLCLIPIGLSASTFTITVGTSVTGAPDTVNIAWAGMTADSLVVLYDPLGYPDARALGAALLLNGGDASISTTVYDTLPSGGYLYFTLLKYQSSTWTKADSALVYVKDWVRAWPRAGCMWLRGGSSTMSTGILDSISVFDIFFQNGNDILAREGATTIANRIAKLDTLHDLNPEIKLATHEYVDNWNPYLYQDFDYYHMGDSAQAVYWDSLVVMMTQDTICPFWLVDTMIVSGSPNFGSNIKITGNTGTIIDDFYPISDATHDFNLLFWDRADSNQFQVMQLTSTNESDSLHVNRRGGRMSSTYGTNLDINNGDTLYLMNNSRINEGASLPDLGGYTKLKGTRGNFDIWRGGEPMEIRARTMAATWADIVAADGDSILDIYMWDVYFPSMVSHTGNSTYGTPAALDDSALINTATTFRTVWGDTRDLNANMQNSGLNGTEEVINAQTWGEAQFEGGTGRWKGSLGEGSGGRDLTFETIARMQAGRYRYGTRTDSWPTYWTMHAPGSNNIDKYRMINALVTLMGGASAQKKPFDYTKAPPDQRLFWADEFWVDNNGIATWSTTLDTNRWWLGWPIEPVQNIIQLGTFPDTLTNGNFESALTRWTDSGADIAVVRSARAAKNGSWGLELQTSNAFAGFGTTYPQGHAWDKWAKYTLGGAGINVVDKGSYTLSFWTRVGGSNVTGEYNSRIAWVKIGDTQDLWSTSFHIPQMWTHVYLPVWVDSSLTDFTDVSVTFGLEKVLLNDKADTLYIDDLALTVGTEFGGFYQRFDNGMVLANVTAETVTVQMPDTANTYIKIQGNAGWTWSDPTYNDSSAVDTVVTIPPEYGLFLFGTPQQAASEALPPDKVAGLDTSSVDTDALNLVWNKVDSTDCAGYMIRYATGATPPADETSGLLSGSTGSRTDTTHSITGLAVNTQYSVSVFAYDEVPNYSAIDAGGQGTWTTDQQPQTTLVTFSDRGDADYSGGIYDTFTNQLDTLTNKGSQTTMWIWSQPLDHGYGYIQFNIAGASFPDNTVVDSAFVDLYCVSVQDPTAYFSLWDMADPWADSTATYASPYGNATVWSPNRGRGSEKLDSLQVTSGNAFYKYTVTAETQEAVNGTTTPNNYLNLTLRRLSEASSSTGVQFATTNHTTASWRPQLRVYYHLNVDQQAALDEVFRLGPPSKLSVATP